MLDGRARQLRTRRHVFEEELYNPGLRSIEKRAPVSVPPDQLLVSELPRIEAVIASVCRRHRCRAEEVEDFSGEVKLKLMADDYAVLRQFEGRANLKTYLTIVVQNYFTDYCNHRWGKWRHSAAAKRLGPVAQKLEELLRDGYGFDQACEELRTNHKVELSPVELAELAGRLPPRRPRRFEGEESLSALSDGEPGPEERLMLARRAVARRRLAGALKKAVEALSDRDKLIVKLDFEEDISLADVARTLDLDEKRIYREKTRILNELGAALRQQGIAPEEVALALGVRELGANRRGRRRGRSVH
jgi:RNA polymerase sigma factor (sigma-70 family)